ncbi:hypothetical protein MKX03_027637 [Papaver bracteatum]|nr:hypothetical protein MKX03_027637 [Papaver bracteatum]
MDDASMKELLSHLPVEELKRFETVSKSWNSLLFNSSFIELHLDNAKLKSRILMVTSEDNFIVFSQYGFRDRCEVLLRVSIPWCSCSAMKLVNGLICLYDRRKHITRIFNPNTGQRTPWAKTSIWLEDAGTLVTAIRGFGFDPVSGKHKVLAIWEISQNYPGNGMLIGKVKWTLCLCKWFHL